MTFSIRTFLIVIAVLSVWLGALVSRSPLFVELAAGGTMLLILLSLALAIWEPRPLLRAFWTGFFALAFGNLLYNGFFSSYQQTSNEVARVIMGNAPGYGVPVIAPGTLIPGGFSPPPGNQSVSSFYPPEEPSADIAPTLVASPYEGSDEQQEIGRSATPEEVRQIERDISEVAPAAVQENPWAYPTLSGAQNATIAPMPSVPPGYPVQLPANTTTYIGNYHEQHEAIQASVPPLISLLMGVVGGCVTMWIAAKRKDDEVSAKVA